MVNNNFPFRVFILSVAVFLMLSVSVIYFYTNHGSGNESLVKTELPAASNLHNINKNQPRENKQNTGIDENWLANVKTQIEKDEYDFCFEKTQDVYSAFNRKNNLRFTFSDDGFRAEPGMTKIPQYDFKSPVYEKSEEYTEIPYWTADIKVSGIGRSGGDYFERFEGKNLSVKDSTAFIEDENLKITYLNNESGMRQDFILKTRPAGEGNVILKLNIETKEKINVSEDGLSVFNAVSNDPLFSYKNLKIWDKNNNKLRGKFVKVPDIKSGITTVDLTIDDTGAEYPLTIDPLLSAPNYNWKVIGGNIDDEFGLSVSTAGDVNGDGYSDVIIGAPGLVYPNRPKNGKVCVFYGSSAGLPLTPNWTASGENNNDQFGFSVSTAGDLNGDGYSDVVIGAYGYSDKKGAVYVFYGSSSGLTSGRFRLEGENAGDNFGFSVKTAGDVNDDGYGDLIIGAWVKDRSYVYYGSSSGISHTPGWTAEYYDEGFGYSVSTAGDVNGDGYSDVIIGAPYYRTGIPLIGKAYLYLGTPQGLSQSPVWIGKGESSYEDKQFGFSVSNAGDVNGDGYSDVIIGAPYANTINSGKVYLYYGNDYGLSTLPNWTLDGGFLLEGLGSVVSTAGDLNGDGYSDIIFSSRGNQHTLGHQGKIYVYYGSSAGILSNGWTMEGEGNNDAFGCSVFTAGDVNGDGFSDLIIGAFNYETTHIEARGAAYLFNGGPSGLSSVWNWKGNGENTHDDFGYSISTAGDVNGDGYGDIIIAAPGFQNNKGKVYVFHGRPYGLNAYSSWSVPGENSGDMFGSSVSTAGDMNGDGYSDVIIGARGYQNNEGKVYVYNGSSDGLYLNPSWIRSGENDNDNFGASVSTAGDVNGDGYSDVIIGATGFYNNGFQGKVYVFFGSSSGISTRNWTAYGEDVGNYFGYSVSTAGDVNGDGYSDVIIGAPCVQNNKGRIYVYYGNSKGILAQKWSSTGYFSGDSLGYSVSAAGDVDGDGYSDVIAGSPGYQNNKGRVYLYYGGPSLPPAPNPAWAENGENAGDAFGHSVSIAGDVDGNGYSDVIIGAPGYSNHKGKVYLYYGGSAGLADTHGNAVTGENNNDNFGCSVSTAGDINGDGFSDVIIGASGLQNSSGRAYLFFGNNMEGKPVQTLLQQYRPGTTTVVSPGGNSTVANKIRLSLLCKSPFGRTRGKLVYEYKDEHTPFSGNPITNSTACTGTGIWTKLTGTGVPVYADISSVPISHDYKWRVRVKYDIVSNPYQVFGPWKYYKNYMPLPAGGFKPTSLHLNYNIPEQYALYQNYPNPFNNTTQITFDLTTDSRVTLVIYDLLGREVIKLANNEYMSAGPNGREFNGQYFSSGVYFCRITAESDVKFTDIKKMILLK
ncbi:MAG: FG-GAP-like repeat-containing protein [Ignavibacteriae bacterium]|nr:FG-GAP-like repeat-containing protein [Ignavibacteriota bacterium]